MITERFGDALARSPERPFLLGATYEHSYSIGAYLERVDELRKQYAQDNPADVAAARKWLHLDETIVT